MQQKPLVLVSNDDGIFAPGLKVLAETLHKNNYDVWVVAPDKDCSGLSSCLTISRPLKIVMQKKWTKPNLAYFSVNGTPVDCVKLALARIAPRKPDWVLSGINRGGNIGMDTLYSGTVGAALEGSLAGCFSMAISAIGSEHALCRYDTAARVVVDLLASLKNKKDSDSTCLNVNVPACDFSDLKAYSQAKLSRRVSSHCYQKMTDPQGKDVYWLGGAGEEFVLKQREDSQLLRRNHVTLTPLNTSLENKDLNLNLEQYFSSEKLQQKSKREQQGLTL